MTYPLLECISRKSSLEESLKLFPLQSINRKHSWFQGRRWRGGQFSILSEAPSSLFCFLEKAVICILAWGRLRIVHGSVWVTRLKIKRYIPLQDLRRWSSSRLITLQSGRLCPFLLSCSVRVNAMPNSLGATPTYQPLGLRVPSWGAIQQNQLNRCKSIEGVADLFMVGSSSNSVMHQRAQLQSCNSHIRWMRLRLPLSRRGWRNLGKRRWEVVMEDKKENNSKQKKRLYSEDFADNETIYLLIWSSEHKVIVKY